MSTDLTRKTTAVTLVERGREVPAGIGRLRLAALTGSSSGAVLVDDQAGAVEDAGEDRVELVVAVLWEPSRCEGGVDTALPESEV
jgi:hypothetical protein